jgi:hypothetical protein
VLHAFPESAGSLKLWIIRNDALRPTEALLRGGHLAFARAGRALARWAVNFVNFGAGAGPPQQAEV